MDGLGHARPGRAFADPGAGDVIASEGDHRPAVIGAGADDVDLVAALRAVLVRPQLVGQRVERRALDVAVAEGELLGQGARLADEGVVLRHAAVVMQADHRAGMVVQPLGAIHLAAVAERDVEEAAVEHQARAEVVSGPRLGPHAEQHLQVAQGASVEPCARHLGALAALARRGVGEIDPAVLRVIRVQHHVEQAALADRRDRRQSGNRNGIEFAVGRHQPQAARPLRHQHAAVRQESQPPRVLQPFGQRFQHEAVLCAVTDLRRRGGGEQGREQRQQAAKELAPVHGMDCSQSPAGFGHGCRLPCLSGT